jgi:hypothetical protein
MAKWKGFGDVEITWEDLSIMRHDVPVMVKDFVMEMKHIGNPRQRALAAALEGLQWVWNCRPWPIATTAMGRCSVWSLYQNYRSLCVRHPSSPLTVMAYLIESSAPNHCSRGLPDAWGKARKPLNAGCSRCYQISAGLLGRPVLSICFGS